LKFIAVLAFEHGQCLFFQLFVRLLQGRQLSSEGRYWLLKTIATFLQSTAVEVEWKHRSVLISEVSIRIELLVFTAVSLHTVVAVQMRIQADDANYSGLNYCLYN
jgi:hypothetical protein